MRPTPEPSRPDPEITVPILGRIDAVPTDLRALVDSFLQHKAARGQRKSGLNNYRQVLHAAIRETGWTSAEHLTTEALLDYIDSRGWSGATYNRNLSIFRGLTRYIANLRGHADPLASAERAIADPAQGSRAASTDEARLIISAASAREHADARCRGQRSAYWLALFLAGCRFSEPAAWRWDQIDLEAEIPTLAWKPADHKNRTRAQLAMAPELAGVLRTLPRDGPKVFPTVPPRTTFRIDRDRAGVAATDRRGLAFSPHSARKWFSTALTAAGVSEKMVDHLMRHAGRPEHRYYDPSLGEQAEALSRLPRLLPSYPQDAHINGPVEEKSAIDLTTGVGLSDDLNANSMGTPTTNSIQPPRPVSPAHVVRTLTSGMRRRGSVEVPGRTADEVSTSASFDPRMPIPGRIIPVDRCADLLDAHGRLLIAVARTLRESRHGDGQ